ncbi:MAG: hypothetical protein HYY45_18660 [Deltaproteobacteria bacterium]|nr:hypothetical protein [Deltaproteobacteria bacterium]
MEKIYVNEIRPNGEVSTVGLFYSRGEAEAVVKKLQDLPEKRGCKYEITATAPAAPTAPRGYKFPRQ